MPGVHIDNFLTAVVVAFVLGTLNILVKPVLIFLSLPVVVLSVGLFLVIINTFIIILTAKLVNGFYVSGFFTALFFSIALSIITSLLYMIQKENERVQ